jgi:mutator protein MutT
MALATLCASLVAHSASNVGARIKKPKGSVSFSAIIMTNEHDQILLLRRKNASFGDGQYALPGGKIESGETALEAARRELAEEVCVGAEQLALAHVVNRQGPETEFYVFIFKALAWTGLPINGEPDKCDDMRWFALEALPENIIDAHRQAIELSGKGVVYSEHGWGSRS